MIVSPRVTDAAVLWEAVDVAMQYAPSDSSNTLHYFLMQPTYYNPTHP